MFDWDLMPLRVHWMEPAIGAGFSVSTPRFKLRYADEDLRRCLSVIAHFCAWQILITIPLWIDNPPKGEGDEQG